MSTKENHNPERQKEIASTIIEQIRSLDRSALMAYGAKDYGFLPESDKRSGGVQFKVNGLLHVGYVMIELTWADEYKITFYKVGKSGITVNKEVEAVHFPELIEVLDYIEGK